MCVSTTLIIYTVQPRLCRVGAQVLWLLMQSVKCNWKVQQSLLFQGFCLCLSCDANHERGGGWLCRPLTSEMNRMTFGDVISAVPFGNESDRGSQMERFIRHPRGCTQRSSCGFTCGELSSLGHHHVSVCQSCPVKETLINDQWVVFMENMAPSTGHTGCPLCLKPQHQSKDILCTHKNMIICKMMKYLVVFYQLKVVFPAASGSVRHFNSTKLIF